MRMFRAEWVRSRWDGLAWDLTVKGDLTASEILTVGERQSCAWEGITSERDLWPFKTFKRVHLYTKPGVGRRTKFKVHSLCWNLDINFSSWVAHLLKAVFL
jgi:hypothetical protein